jgi:hypothetical protein
VFHICGTGPVSEEGPHLYYCGIQWPEAVRPRSQIVAAINTGAVDAVAATVALIHFNQLHARNNNTVQANARSASQVQRRPPGGMYLYIMAVYGLCTPQSQQATATL